MSTVGIAPDAPHRFKLIVGPQGTARIATFATRPRWTELITRTATLCECSPQAISLSYLDEEGDEITLSTDDELAQRCTEIPTGQPIRFNVTISAPPPPPPPAAPADLARQGAYPTQYHYDDRGPPPGAYGRPPPGYGPPRHFSDRHGRDRGGGPPPPGPSSFNYMRLPPPFPRRDDERDDTDDGALAAAFGFPPPPEHRSRHHHCGPPPFFRHSRSHSRDRWRGPPPSGWGAEIPRDGGEDENENEDARGTGSGASSGRRRRSPSTMSASSSSNASYPIGPSATPPPHGPPPRHYGPPSFHHGGPRRHRPHSPSSPPRIKSIAGPEGSADDKKNSDESARAEGEEVEEEDDWESEGGRSRYHHHRQQQHHPQFHRWERSRGDRREANYPFAQGEFGHQGPGRHHHGPPPFERHGLPGEHEEHESPWVRGDGGPPPGMRDWDDHHRRGEWDEHPGHHERGQHRGRHRHHGGDGGGPSRHSSPPPGPPGVHGGDPNEYNDGPGEYGRFPGRSHGSRRRHSPQGKPYHGPGRRQWDEREGGFDPRFGPPPGGPWEELGEHQFPRPPPGKWDSPPAAESPRDVEAAVVGMEGLVLEENKGGEVAKTVGLGERAESEATAAAGAGE